MNIILKTKSSTAKAWQLENGSWIPKSTVQGIGKPFQILNDWYFKKVMESAVKGDQHFIKKYDALVACEQLYNIANKLPSLKQPIKITLSPYYVIKNVYEKDVLFNSVKYWNLDDVKSVFNNKINIKQFWCIVKYQHDDSRDRYISTIVHQCTLIPRSDI